MKFKISIFIIFILIVYFLVPIGEYSIDDVSINNMNNMNTQFASMKLTSTEFVERVESNVKPEVGYIVHPSTAISRDNDNSVSAILAITSGWYREGSFQSGKLHGALDSDVVGHKNLSSCPSGHSDCDDTVLIAPVSGIIEKVVNNVGNESAYYKDQKHNSMVVIKATGVFKGRSIWIMHLANIPDNIVVGYQIKQGEYIGTQCAQGQSTGSHVHMEVRNGTARVNIAEWFKSLTFHSSIKEVKDYTGSNPSTDVQGWVKDDIIIINNNPRYNSEIVVPNKYKVI